MEDMTPPTTAIDSPNPSDPFPPSTPNSPNFPPNLSEIQNFSSNFASMYHSIFPPISSLPSSLSFTPSPCSSTDEEDHNNHNLHTAAAYTTTTDDVLYQARLVLEYRELREYHDLCLRRLRDLTRETDYLRRENAKLRLANTELVKLLSSKTANDDPFTSPISPISMDHLFSDNHGLLIGGGIGDNIGLNGKEIAYDTISPTSVIRSHQFVGTNLQQISLPKSISVRSIGLSKTNSQRGAPVPTPLSTESRQVCFPTRGGGGGSAIRKDEEAIELEVYNQGMTKTELCNKWRETGECPYGNHCRFAHGLKELRPVMRHPRYKTEVCKMVLAGQMCPYAHRCHFRHSLSAREGS